MLDKHTEFLIKKAREIHGDKFDYSQTVFTGKGKKFKLICKKHGIFLTDRQRLIYQKNGCKKCEVEELIEFRLNQAKRHHGDYYDYTGVDWTISSVNRITIGCPKHGRVTVSMFSHLNGSKCKQCVTDSDRLTPETYFKRATEQHNGFYDYSESIYNGVNQLITIRCPEHGYFTQRAGSHSPQGNGCLKCFNEKINRSNKDEFVKKAREIHGSRYNYDDVDYVGNKTKVKIRCKRHGVFEIQPNSHLNGGGCSRCRASKGEVMLTTFLEKNNIKFVTEKKLPNFKYRYDIYLPDHDILIEFHGIQHFEPVEKFGGMANLEMTKQRDKAKVILAKSSGMTLLTYNYKQFKKGRLLKKFRKDLIKHNVMGCPL